MYKKLPYSLIHDSAREVDCFEIILHPFQKEESKIVMKWELNMAMVNLNVKYPVPLTPLSQFIFDLTTCPGVGCRKTVHHKENTQRDCPSE